MSKVKQGSKEYLNYQKKVETGKTILMFVISLTLFFSGWFFMKTKANAFTIISVLGILPASNSAVSMIMYLKAKGGSESFFAKLDSYKKDLIHAYNFVITTRDLAYEVPSVVVKNSFICGCTIKEYKEKSLLEAHIKDLLAKNGYVVTVKMFDKEALYFEELQKLTTLKESDEESMQRDLKIMEILGRLSL